MRFFPLCLAFACLTGAPAARAAAPPLRVGMIGLDTSHAPAFTKLLNDPAAPEELAGCPVVVATPQGSPDLQASAARVGKFTQEVRDLGVEIVDTVDALVAKCDVVLLESVDGRVHLEQALPVLRAGKPVFIDKPLAASLVDAVAIVEVAQRRKVPLFSSSALRFSPGVQAMRHGAQAGIGPVRHAETTGPCAHEPTHPDLFWYGIHGIEALFTVMGPECTVVRRTQATATADEVQARWSGGRTGLFRGDVTGKAAFGGVVTGPQGERRLGEFGGYRPLVVEIVKFFRSGTPPVDPQETLAIMAFMAAADESKHRDGAEVELAGVLDQARRDAAARLAALGE
jgi:predicted dehydrogenase